MKIIHTSDIHLNSKMESILSQEKAKQRKQELLFTFNRLVEYAKENKIDAILIAGDLFDTESINKQTAEYVFSLIENNSNIAFLYLCGNHEKRSFLNYIKTVPSNLVTFDNTWQSYDLGENIVVSGISITKENCKSLYPELKLDKNNFNIVMMHGQVSKYFSDDNFEIVNLTELKNKNINYLALGHIHTHLEDKLDDNANYCYPGCLEGRGFDECGKKGFVELEILNNNLTSKFVPFAKREIVEVCVDISNIAKLKDIDDKILNSIKDISKDNLIKIKLTGDITEDTDLNIDFIQNNLNETYYLVKIENNTKLKIDIEKYKNDISLKGEFIRCVLNGNLSEEEKEQVLMFGLKALNGEVDL